MKNPFSELYKGSELAAEIADYREKFSPKPYAVQYRKLYRVASGGRALFGLLSILSGGAFVGGLIASAGVPVITGLIAGVLLMVFFEVLKAQLVELSAITFLSEKRLPVFGLLTAGVFALSVYVSLLGVQDIHRLTDKQTANVELAALAQSDSVRAAYDAMIAKEEAALADYRKSVSWAGKIDVSNKATQTVLATHTNQIARLQNEKAAALAGVQAKANEGMIAAQSASERYGVSMLALCIINEISILACLIFVFYYQFRSAREGLSADQSVTVHLSDIREMVQFFSNEKPANQITAGPGPQNGKIGFRPDGQSVPPVSAYSVPEKPEISGKNRQSLTKHSVENWENLLADIRSGTTDYRTLMSRWGVNVLTVKRAFETLAKS